MSELLWTGHGEVYRKTRVLIEFAWFIGCSIVIITLLIGLFFMTKHSHNTFYFQATLGKTFLLTICLVFWIVPYSEIAVNIITPVSNFLRMCFGSNIDKIGRLELALQDTSNFYHPFYLLGSIYCFISHIVAAKKGKRTTALILLPVIIAIEFIILMCIIDKIPTFLLVFILFGLIASEWKGSPNPNVEEELPYDEDRELRAKGFAKSYISKNLGSYVFTAHDIYCDNNRVRLYAGFMSPFPEIIAYKNGSGTLIDEEGNIYEPYSI